MAVKLLVCGLESSGKSSITSKIKGALVINFDNKEYNFEVFSSDFKEYNGVGSVVDFINNKVSKYKEVNGEFPKVVVLDTVTQMYSMMILHNSKKYSVFNIHTQNNIDTLEFNNYLEDVLLANGVDVVVVAHTVFDDNTKAFTIAANGQFAKAGSFLSIVNDAIFIDKKGGKLTVYLNDIKYPSRSTIGGIQDKVGVDEYDINEHLDKLRQKQETITNKFKL